MKTLPAQIPMMTAMYLLDTNVISEIRKRQRANAGVIRFFSKVDSTDCFLSVVTLGELQRGVEKIRHRGDEVQAQLLADWLDSVVKDFGSRFLPFESDAAQLWGHLCVPQSHHVIDKQIAATALVHDLTLVTRNTKDFEGLGLRLLNPFT